MIAELALLLIGTVLANNIVLMQFLGAGPALTGPRQLAPLLGICLASALLLTLGSILTHLVFHHVLAPLGLEYLRTLIFVLIIATSAQLAQWYMRSTGPIAWRVFDRFLPLVAVNCAVLGVVLLNVQREYDALHALVHGVGAAGALTLVMLLCWALRERIEAADVPGPFRGAAIGLVTMGLMSLAFMGFAGLA